MRNHASLLFLAAGAAIASVTLVACDRTLDEAQAAEPVPAIGIPPRPPAPSSLGSDATATPLPGDPLADTVITGQVKSAIQADPHMNGADVSVNTDRGVVSLAGTVRTPEQLAVASAYAQRQDGVMRVDNHLTVERQ